MGLHLGINHKTTDLAGYVCKGKLLLCLIALLYISLLFGNGVGRGAFRGKTLRKYVYPHSKKTVREVIDGELDDNPDPQGTAVCIYTEIY